MTAAKTKLRAMSQAKLLVISRASQPGTRLSHRMFEDLSEVLEPGDLLVVNDAATLPASLQGVHQRTGTDLEMRLASLISGSVSDPSKWIAIFFGQGSWRTPTELRLAPPELRQGDLIHFGGRLTARVLGARDRSGRSAEIEWIGSKSEIWAGLYQVGRPIQYSHLRDDLELWDVQTAVSGLPVALEAPSAAFALRWRLIQKINERGVRIEHLTHSAGISSTGVAELDGLLPFPEWYKIPPSTAAAIEATRLQGRRVIALGTSVTRALESSALAHGAVVAGEGIARLVITPEHRLRAVDGIISGFHDLGASHLELLVSFVDRGVLDEAYVEAEKRGYLSHEFGDACLII